MLPSMSLKVKVKCRRNVITFREYRNAYSHQDTSVCEQLAAGVLLEINVGKHPKVGQSLAYPWGCTARGKT